MKNTITSKIIRSKADIIHLIDLIETDFEKAEKNKDLILDNLREIKDTMEIVVRLND
jgi:hypothetical protein